jgi:vanillin dehydrogenase
MPIAAVESCAVGFADWRLSTPERRRDILLKAADLLGDRVGKFTDLMAAETGAATGWVKFNVHTSIGMLREAAGITSQVKGKVIPGNKPGMWNFPTASGRMIDVLRQAALPGIIR